MTAKKSAAPKPRTRAKKPLRVCPGGHRQSSKWRPGDSCWQCDRDADREYRRAIADAGSAAAERAAAMADIPPLPDSFEIRSGDGKSVQSFGIRPGRRLRRAR